MKKIITFVQNSGFMNRRVFLNSLFLIGIAFSVQAQQPAPLTIREAFDFAVNDTFIYHHVQFRRYKQYVILARFEKGDTLAYVRKNESWLSFTPPPPFQNQTGYQLYIDTVRYTRLNALVFTLLDSFPKPVYDKTFSNPNRYKGRTITQRQNGEKIQSAWVNDFGRGLGLVNWSQYSEDPGSNYWFDLIYYRKGDEQWGWRPVLVDVDDPRSEGLANARLWPNPAASVLHIETAVDFDRIFLLDVVGNIHPLQASETLDVGHLPAGMYRLFLYKKGVLRAAGAFIK
jgi:hypothetical protein